jgi:hypothetical protein
MAKGKGGKGFLGTHGKIPRGVYHAGGGASKKVGVIHSPYKDTIVKRGGSAR